MNRKHLFIALLFLQSTFTSLAQTASFDSTITYRITNLWQGEKKSLDILNDGKQNNFPWLSTSEDVSGQSWKIVATGDGYFKLSTTWHGPGKVLDVINDGKNNKLQLANNGAYSGQYWKIASVGNGYYRLISRWQGDGKSVDVVNDGKNNNQLILAKSGGYSGQYWKIVPYTRVINVPVVPTVPVIDSNRGDPVFKNQASYRITNSSTVIKGKSLDVVNDGKKNKVQLAGSGPYTGQYWTLTPFPGYPGYYRLTNLFLGNDLSLDIVNDGTNNKITFGTTGMISGQAWKITRLFNGYYRLTTNFQGDDKSLDVLNDGKYTQLRLNKSGPVSGQHWMITEITHENTVPVAPVVPVVPVVDSTKNLPVFNNLASYRITNLWDATKGKSLDVVNDGKKDKVQLAGSGAYSGQYWTLTPFPGYPGYYRLTNLFVGSDLSLDIVNDGTNNKITFGTTGMKSGQAWKITPLPNGYYRLTTHFQGDGKALDVINDGKNTQLHLSKTAEASGQYWLITEIK
jgi:Ricin-type beta-trefoil lectin domain-like